jgi:hypothetical protein
MIVLTAFFVVALIVGLGILILAIAVALGSGSTD